MNNFEKLKNMTIEEAENLPNTLLATLCRNYCRGCKDSKYDCKEAMRKWLNEETN